MMNLDIKYRKSFDFQQADNSALYLGAYVFLITLDRWSRFFHRADRFYLGFGRHSSQDYA